MLSQRLMRMVGKGAERACPRLPSTPSHHSKRTTWVRRIRAFAHRTLAADLRPLHILCSCVSPATPGYHCPTPPGRLRKNLHVQESGDRVARLEPITNWLRLGRMAYNRERFDLLLMPRPSCDQSSTHPAVDRNACLNAGSSNQELPVWMYLLKEADPLNQAELHPRTIVHSCVSIHLHVTEANHADCIANRWDGVTETNGVLE